MRKISIVFILLGNLTFAQSSFDGFTNKEKKAHLTKTKKNDALEKKRVLLIGIDGLQLEQITNTKTPNFDKFYIAKGYTGGEYGTDTQQITSSGPGWVSILTGKWSNKHGVKNNNVKHVSKAPGIFTYIQESTHKRCSLASFVTWKQASLFLPQDMYKQEVASIGGGDEYNVEHMSSYIKKKSPVFSFIHIDEIDHMGHAHGFGKEYTKAVEHVDKEIGQLLKAVSYREKKHKEQWLVILVTDHGRDAKGRGHGGQSLSQKTIFIGMNQKGTSFFQSCIEAKEITSYQQLEAYIPQTSIVPTVLKYLEIPIHEKWELVAPLVE